MKVLQVVPSYYPAIVYGGPIFSIHYMCQALARQGIQTYVATTNANGKRKLDVSTRLPVRFERNYQVRYYDETIIGRFSWMFTRRLWGDVKHCDLVHLQDVFSLHAAWTLILATVTRKPVLVSPRGIFTKWALASKRSWLKKAWILILVRPFVRNTRRVAWHATSEAERDEIQAIFPRVRIHVVPNGIDCAVFNSAPALSRSEYLARFMPNRAVALNRINVMIGLGRLHPVKGFDIAIKAFHLLAGTRSDLVLLIGGSDSGSQRQLERLIEDLQLGGRVVLVGEVRGEDKIAFLKGADLFLLPSHSENFGMAALEALAAGVPVLASRKTPWGGLEAAGAGLWVDNTAPAFAKAMSELLSHDFSEMRTRARSYASQYDLGMIGATFKEIYREMIDGRR